MYSCNCHVFCFLPLSITASGVLLFALQHSYKLGCFVFFQMKANKQQTQMQIIQEQTDVRGSKTCIEGESKVRSCWTLKSFPWISPTGAQVAYFHLYLPSLHIPRNQLPGITLNRQTDGRKRKKTSGALQKLNIIYVTTLSGIEVGKPLRDRWRMARQ